jgi:hypothetical protein
MPFTQFQTSNLGKKKLAGTPIYASINAHLANGECNKKDDLESMMYVLV